HHFSNVTDDNDILAARAKTGDAAALTELLARFRPRLLGYFRRRTGGHPDHEDLTQETLARAIAALPETSDRTHVTAWVFRIARNLVIDWYRSNARVPGGRQRSLEHLGERSGRPWWEAVPAEWQRTPDGRDPADVVAASDQLRRWCGLLTPHQREVLMLRLRGLDQRAIARALLIRHGLFGAALAACLEQETQAVNQRLARARARIRAIERGEAIEAPHSRPLPEAVRPPGYLPPVGGGRFTPAVVEEMAWLSSYGWKIRAIAERYGTADRYVRQLIRGHKGVGIVSARRQRMLELLRDHSVEETAALCRTKPRTVRRLLRKSRQQPTA
ncbi:MAG: RNA polymerase sigma factor, partial [Chloroflexota bacterium]